jgi:site-specific recombinase
VWPWYIYKRAKEPIKATDTTVQAYAKYLDKSQDEISEGISLDKVSNETIQERLAKKEPVKEVKDDSGKVLGYETHKIVQPIKDEKHPENENKIRVFSNPFFKQANKFQEKIREAEKEIKQESRNRPRN